MRNCVVESYSVRFGELSSCRDTQVTGPKEGADYAGQDPSHIRLTRGSPHIFQVLRSKTLYTYQELRASLVTQKNTLHVTIDFSDD